MNAYKLFSALAVMTLVAIGAHLASVPVAIGSGTVPQVELAASTSDPFVLDARASTPIGLVATCIALALALAVFIGRVVLPPLRRSGFLHARRRAGREFRRFAFWPPDPKLVPS